MLVPDSHTSHTSHMAFDGNESTTTPQSPHSPEPAFCSSYHETKELHTSSHMEHIPHICHFFTQAKFLENKIYTEKTRKLRQNTQKIANFLR